MAQTIRNKYLNYWWDLSSLMTVLEPYSQLWSSEELFFFFFNYFQKAHILFSRSNEFKALKQS